MSGRPPVRTLVPDETPVAAAGEFAALTGETLQTDGAHAIIAPDLQPGYTRVRVKIKEAKADAPDSPHPEEL